MTLYASRLKSIKVIDVTSHFKVSHERDPTTIIKEVVHDVSSLSKCPLAPLKFSLLITNDDD